MISCCITGEDPDSDSKSCLDTQGLSLLMSSGIDIDKLDYMVRDAYYTGVPYGNSADVRKLCNCLYTERNNHERRVVIKYKMVSSIIALLTARFSAFAGFINHHVPSIAQEMLLKEIVPYLEGLGDDEKRKYFQYDDKTFLFKLSNSGNKNISNIIFEIEERFLFKRLYVYILDNKKCYSFDVRRRLEKKLSQSHKLDDITKDDVLIVFCPGKDFLPEGAKNLYVVRSKGEEDKFSDLFPHLEDIKVKSKIMICCRDEEDIKKKVKSFVKSKLGRKRKIIFEWESKDGDD